MKHKIRVEMNANEVQWLYSQDWEYYDYGNCKRHLQIIFPFRQEMSKDEKYPLILFIPGSAWHKQEMYNDLPQYALLARRGFEIAAMEYRESDIAPFPAQIEDVYNALNFIPGIADLFHIDADKVFLMGNSSGGHVAMMSVLFHAHGLCKALPKISGVICESGSTDLLICAKEELPPILLLHSEYDPIVSVANSRTLYERLIACHHNVSYYELAENNAHGGAVYYDSAILNIIDEFCKKHSDM